MNIDCRWMVSLGQWTDCNWHWTTVYVRCPRETIQLQSMFVVRERLFNCSLFAVQERPLNGLSRTMNIDCRWMVSLGQWTDCNWMVSLGQRTLIVVEWSLSDNEQTVVEWSLSDNENCSWMVSFNYILCSLSERDQSTTVYVRCPREIIQLQSVRCPKEATQDNEQTVVEWSLPDNEQIVVEWPLSDSEQTVVE
jgi:hypothetical protein